MYPNIGTILWLRISDKIETSFHLEESISQTWELDKFWGGEARTWQQQVSGWQLLPVRARALVQVVNAMALVPLPEKMP